MTKKFLHSTLVLWGAIIAILWIVGVTIVSEIYPPLKEWLGNIFTHHWIGKSSITISIVVLFTLAGRYIRQENKTTLSSGGIWLLFWVALLGVLSIIVFFAAHTFYI